MEGETQPENKRTGDLLQKINFLMLMEVVVIAVYAASKADPGWHQAFQNMAVGIGISFAVFGR